SEAHQLGGGITDRGTLHIEPDAGSHHADVFFLCAGRSAVIANGCTTKAGIDAGLVLLVSFHKHIFCVPVKKIHAISDLHLLRAAGKVSVTFAFPMANSRRASFSSFLTWVLCTSDSRSLVPLFRASRNI